MGILVIGGLLSSTLLTLIVVPSVYTLAEDGAAAAARAVVRLRARRGSAPVAKPVSLLLDSPHSEERP